MCVKTANPVTRARLIPGILLIVLVSGCDFGPGHMMGGSTVPTRYANNGERIYFTGTSASGNSITRKGGNMHMSMMGGGGGCATCHGSDRLGSRMMPNFWKTAPPLTRGALFETHDDGDGHGGHERYRYETLRRAVFRGIDPAGEPLDGIMPRWSMSDRDWTDLVAYLRSER